MAVHDVAYNLKKKSGMMFSHREAKPGAKAGTWNVWRPIHQRCRNREIAWTCDEVFCLEFSRVSVLCVCWIGELECFKVVEYLPAGLVLLGPSWSSIAGALLPSTSVAPQFLLIFRPIFVRLFSSFSGDDSRLWCGSFPNCHTCDAECDRRKIWEVDSQSGITCALVPSSCLSFCLNWDFKYFKSPFFCIVPLLALGMPAYWLLTQNLEVWLQPCVASVLSV